MDSFHYKQVIQSATFISAGSLLDHVYIKEAICDSINNYIVSVYYSDHEAIKLSIHFNTCTVEPIAVTTYWK